MEKPTKEGLRGIRSVAVVSGDTGIIDLVDAYLAQEEELKRVWKLVKYQDGFIMEKSKDAADRLQEINRLEAENQALKAELKVAISGIDDYWDQTYLANGALYTTTICQKYGWDHTEARQ